MFLVFCSSGDISSRFEPASDQIRETETKIEKMYKAVFFFTYTISLVIAYACYHENKRRKPVTGILKYCRFTMWLLSYSTTKKKNKRLYLRVSFAMRFVAPVSVFGAILCKTIQPNNNDPHWMVQLFANLVLICHWTWSSLVIHERKYKIINIVVSSFSLFFFLHMRGVNHAFVTREIWNIEIQPPLENVRWKKGNWQKIQIRKQIRCLQMILNNLRDKYNQLNCGVIGEMIYEWWFLPDDLNDLIWNNNHKKKKNTIDNLHNLFYS